jgi:hypothetical protein
MRALVAVVAFLAATTARAAETPPTTGGAALDGATQNARVPVAAPQVDEGEERSGAQGFEQRTVEQPFLYIVDPHGPAPKQLLLGYALAFSSSAGAIRPVPGNFDQEAVVHALSLAVGVVQRLSIYGQAMIGEPIGHSDVGAVAVEAGLRVLVTPPRWERLRVVVQAGLLREFGADLGFTGEVTGSYDIGRVRLAATLHAEHLFAPGRDPLDLYSVVGASVRVLPLLRFGAEYVAEDIEEAGSDDDAEHGMRHYVGPNMSLALYRRRILMTAGSAVQVARAPGLLARAAFTYVY